MNLYDAEKTRFTCEIVDSSETVLQFWSQGYVASGERLETGKHEFSVTYINL